jgi:recombinational DNA repair ATPase RecF
MEKLIKDVIELDKVYRSKVEDLNQEKEKINVFLQEEKKRQKKQYENDAKAKIKQLQADIAADLEKRKQEEIAEAGTLLANLEAGFASNRTEWIDNIYNYCINNK